MNNKQPLIVVLGPTACGKSGLGIELALRRNGEIVSADSRQIYRGLDLGTGKVTEEETRGIPHAMLDVIDPNDTYSVALFQRGAYAAIDDMARRGKLPFLVGGTGLYVRAVTDGFCFEDGGAPDPALRAELDAMDLPALQERFRSLNCPVPDNLDLQNPRRVIRAIERATAGVESQPSEPRYRTLLLGVSYPRETICERIDRRLLARLELGMVDEIAALRANGATDEFLDGLGLEYRYTLYYLRGKFTYDEYVDELSRAIKRFAKRQTKWFARDVGVHWLDMTGDPVSEALALIDDFLKD